MNAPVPVATELAALEGFAYELFCQAAEETSRPRRAASLACLSAALNPERLEKTARSPEESQLLRSRSVIPLAHRLWLAHLLWLEEVLHTLDCRPTEVTAVELAGLQAVARARARFLRAHQFCPYCEAANPRWASRCRRCAKEL